MVRTLGDRTLVLVADGAGGVSRGAEAAEALCAAFSSCECASPRDWSEWLGERDREAAASGSVGLAAVVAFSVSVDGTVSGASVGDCEAWVFERGNWATLTEGQIRKPLLGSGDARAVGFTRRVPGGTIVAASDGLWKYASPASIVDAVAVRPLETAAAALVDSVRLRGGVLQDDVAIAVVDLTST